MNSLRLVLPLVATREGALCCWQGKNGSPETCVSVVVDVPTFIQQVKLPSSQGCGVSNIPSSAVPAWFQSLER